MIGIELFTSVPEVIEKLAAIHFFRFFINPVLHFPHLQLHRRNLLFVILPQGASPLSKAFPAFIYHTPYPAGKQLNSAHYLIYNWLFVCFLRTIDAASWIFHTRCPPVRPGHSNITLPFFMQCTRGLRIQFAEPAPHARNRMCCLWQFCGRRPPWKGWLYKP